MEAREVEPDAELTRDVELRAESVGEQQRWRRAIRRRWWGERVDLDER
jgi:hypothetical protein